MVAHPHAELDFQAPHFDATSALSSKVWGDMRTSAIGSSSDARPANAGSPRYLEFPNIYGDHATAGAVTAKDLPLLNDTIKEELGKAKGLEYSSAADNKANGQQPDYRLVVGKDGKLALQKMGKEDALKDGKLNIEIDTNNKSLQEAIKNADKNLKEYIREQMAYWKDSHPGEQYPGWWQDVLDSQPNIPQDAQPVPIQPASDSQPDPPPTPEPPTPTPSEQTPQPGGGSDGGGGGGGGGSGGGGGGGGGDGGGRGGGGDAPPIPNLPDATNGNPDSVNGNDLLTSDQEKFVSELAKKTGLDANVIGAWVLNEESGSAAQGRQAQGNNDWLNIGYTDSGERGTANQELWFSGPEKAADATAAWLKGELDVPGFGRAAPGIQDILQSAGKSPAEQIQALQASPWASSHYPELPNIYQNLVAHNQPAPDGGGTAVASADGLAFPLQKSVAGAPGSWSLDQGVDITAPGHSPLYAIADGTVSYQHVSGFDNGSPTVPILHVTSGPLAGNDVYYGHAGPGAEVNGGQGGEVKAGQQIGEVGDGIVGQSTGPHLEIGFTSAFGKGHDGDGSNKTVENVLQKTYNA